MLETLNLIFKKLIHLKLARKQTCNDHLTLKHANHSKNSKTLAT